MVGKIRESLNQAPPWVGYGIVGAVLVVVVLIIVLQMGSESPGAAGDKHFYCEECDAGFTVAADESSRLLREASKAAGGKPGLVKCPKCGKRTCILGRKCQKCGAYFTIVPSEDGVIMADSWKDECPKCGYSAQKADYIKMALKQKKEGKYNPDQLPDFMREAVEEAEESGEYDK